MQSTTNGRPLPTLAVPGPQGVAGELAWVEAGGAGAFLDDQRNGLCREWGGDGACAGHAPEESIKISPLPQDQSVLRRSSQLSGCRSTSV